MPLGAILGTVGGLIGGLANSVTSVINTNKTNKANKDLAEYQYSKDVESWNRQNAYNSPAAQMERYTSAGLNPNMIYGSGTASAGNAQSMPHYQAPTQQYNYQPPNVLPQISTYADLAIKKATVDRIKAQTQNENLSVALNAASLQADIASRGYKKSLLGNQSDSMWYQKTMNAINASVLDSLHQSGALTERYLQQNQLQTKSLEKYSSDIQGTNLSNKFKAMQNEWYGSAGLRGASDVLPWIKMLMGK